MDDKTSAVLELDGERTVTFRDRGHAYTYTFSRIGSGDWLRYFEGVAITSRREGKNGVVETMDLESAGVDLVESKVVKAEGYAGDFMSDPKWKQCLPFGHVRAAAQLLRDGNISLADDSQPLNPLKVEVAIDAKWNVSKPRRNAPVRRTPASLQSSHGRAQAQIQPRHLADTRDRRCALRHSPSFKDGSGYSSIFTTS
jgi:hypothetical protein